MNLGKEFEKFAIKDRGISSNTLHGYTNHMVTNLTPNIIEERPMNVAVMDVYSRLMMDRIIFLGYPITDEVANIITAQLLFLDSTDRTLDIQIYINSPGGGVTSGMVIYDTMRMIKSPVSTICMGMAASMGSILLSGGEKGKRFIFPHGEVMIHQPSGGGQGTSADLEIMADQIRKIKELGAKILAENCGQPFEKIMKDFNRDYWMGAEESVHYGIVDGILDSI